MSNQPTPEEVLMDWDTQGDKTTVRDLREALREAIGQRDAARATILMLANAKEAHESCWQELLETRKERDKALAKLRYAEDTATIQGAELMAAMKQRDKFREALEWYANSGGPSYLYEDGGDLARETLGIQQTREQK